jgi:two-component system sensor histidine kinase VicK
MTPEQAEKAFEKFYRVDGSNTAASGTGLGMTVVKYIVEARGGRVWIESEYGMGTTIKFTFPILFGASISQGGSSEKNSDRR